MMRFGPWAERLEAVAVGYKRIALAGRRDAPGVSSSTVHVLPLTLPDEKNSQRAFDAGAAVNALAFAGDDLLLTAAADGRLIAWDVGARRALASLSLGTALRALAVDAEVARGAAGKLAVGQADGTLHEIHFTIENGTPQLTSHTSHTLGSAIHCLAYDPAGLWLAGVADHHLWIVGKEPRAVSPGGDGGIRAVCAVGDGRAVLGCGDGSIRSCFVVGEVEPLDRSGDHAHQGAVRGLALGPVVLDEAQREAPRRLFSVGEDGVLKIWFLDGARRPKSIEPKVGPLTALAFAPGRVAKHETAAGRLFAASLERQLYVGVVSADLDGVLESNRVGSVFQQYEPLLRDAKVAVKVKLEVLTALAELPEDAAREALDIALASGPNEVSIAAAEVIARSGRKQSRPALRTALAASTAALRAAAFKALLQLEDQPLAAVRGALTSKFDDVRVLAVDALVPLAPTSLLAAGMIAEALRDTHAGVRSRAYAVLHQVASTPLEAIRTALARGLPDIRGHALLDLGMRLQLRDAAARELAASAFDDDEPGVRAAAFMAALAMRPSLAAQLLARSPELKRQWDEICAQLQVQFVPNAGQVQGPIQDEDLEALFAQLACRHADMAIAAAGCLVVLGDSRAIGALLQLTREPAADLRRRVIHNLVWALEQWPDDDRLTTRLTWLLDDADDDVRSRAFDSLAKTAAAQDMNAGVDAQLELARVALRTSQENIRVRALALLVSLGGPAQPAAERARSLLGDALDDEAEKVRKEAFRTLWAWHSSEPLAPLTRGAHSRHADLRLQVVQEIARRRQAKQDNAAMNALLVQLVGDSNAQVGLTAYSELTRQPEAGPEVKIPPEVYVAAMQSPVAAVRAAGATGAARAPAASVRESLLKLIKDDQRTVHLAAIEALDRVAPTDTTGFMHAWASSYWELQVRAGELCGRRRDARAIAPMERILAIAATDPNRPPDVIRQRAARALADVGAASTISFQLALLDDTDSVVREMAARGIATAATASDAQARTALLRLLSHADLAVRSWGGEGLAKLGDLRALPVLAGTQQHEHRPLRIGAITGFVALGPDGVRGLRQGLEDRDREIQELAFAVIVARDVALADAGIEPDLLVDAMAAPSAEIRFAAARLYEQRAAGEPLTHEVIGEIIGPHQPEKARDMKDWPAAGRRATILKSLASAIASDNPEVRYAATQVLAVRPQPLTFWQEAQRLGWPERADGAAPRTNWSSEATIGRRTGWLRRLVNEARTSTGLEAQVKLFLRAGTPYVVDPAVAQRLVFGAYAGLVRQAPLPGAADETHRVRRDAIGRLRALAHEPAVGAEAVQPVLSHALGDPHHLVRQAAMQALRSLYPVGALAPLALAIQAAADLSKPALAELMELARAGDERARPILQAALDASERETRLAALEQLATLYPPGSTELQLLAAQSKHHDVRLSAIQQLASAPLSTPAVVDALVAALGSEHADLRMMAAIALARSPMPEQRAPGIEVLGWFLRDEEHWEAAIEALLGLADQPDSVAAAAAVIASRIDESLELSAETVSELLTALETLASPAVLPTLVRLLMEFPAGKETEYAQVAERAFSTLRACTLDRSRRPQALPNGELRQRYHEELALSALREACRSPHVGVRTSAAAMLADIDAPAAEPLLEKLLLDRDAGVRVRAAETLALRAEHVPGATLAPLEAALRGGRRELVLPAALGLAARGRPEAFQPLLLVAKVGEGIERERALLALGSLGDRRALEHLVPLLDPEPDDEAARALTPAAVEAVGRLLPALVGDEAATMYQRLERLAQSGSPPLCQRALTGLRYAHHEPLVARVASDREVMTEVRVHAVRELGLAAQPASEVVLAELLSDPEWDVREQAVIALEKVLRGERTRTALHALGSPFDEISRPAAAYLANEGDPQVLITRLGEIRSADNRRRLRDGLIRRGAEVIATVGPALEAALRGADPLPRIEAAWIVGAAATASLAPAVVAATERAATGWAEAKARAHAGLMESEAHAWQAALWAARRVQAAVATPASAALRNEQAPATVRREAASVLAADTSPQSLQALSAVLGDVDREVRAIATQAVAARAPTNAAALVRELGPRADAGTLAPLALTAWPQVAGELLAEPTTRWWSLAVSLTGQRTSELLAVAQVKGHAGRLAAIAALGRLDGETVERVLGAIHNDRSEEDEVRLAAWKALRRISRRKPRVFAAGVDKPRRGAVALAGGHADDDDHDDDHDDDDSGDEDEGGSEDEDADEDDERYADVDEDDGDEDDYDEDDDAEDEDEDDEEDEDDDE